MEDNKLGESVVVLTPTILSIDQLKILNKGLSFSLDSHFDLFQTILDVNKFSRLLTVKRHLSTEKEVVETSAAITDGQL